VFPSLTFPSHVSQVTGANVDKHGIILNAIYDRTRDRRWSYPNEAAEILCEPIWTTAKRQGRRVLVHDWPVSQQQTGDFKADYFDQAFDSDLNDRERVDRLAKLWEGDCEKQPLQLVMGYCSQVDKAGHKYGPDTPETKKAVETVDNLLERVFTSSEAQFQKCMSPDDTFYFVVTTDHGMDELRVITNLQMMCGSAWKDEMRSVVSGSVGHIFLDRLGPPPARKPLVAAILKRLEQYPFAKAYARDDLPAEWGYNHPTRTGDVVVSLENEYMFSERGGAEMHVTDGIDGPLGMHGYPVENNPKMYGFMAIYRSGKPLGGKDLGEVDSRRMHATVAKWLKIKPAETALPEPLPID
jgi:predicted AlkP superfamily pyrophosphatase or phosphodiesterase